MIIAKESSSIQAWGNSTAFRIPKQLAAILNLRPNDKVTLQVEIDEVGQKKLVIDKNQEAQTIQELFADYKEEPFQAKVAEFEPMGEELW